jgi:hypothetical protein
MISQATGIRDCECAVAETLVNIDHEDLSYASRQTRAQDLARHVLRLAFDVATALSCCPAGARSGLDYATRPV